MSDEHAEETLTAEGEDSEAEVLRWHIEQLKAHLRLAQEEAAKRDVTNHNRMVRLNAELDYLRALVERITSSMTVAELRRVGVRVDLNYDEED